MNTCTFSMDILWCIGKLDDSQTLTVQNDNIFKNKKNCPPSSAVGEGCGAWPGPHRILPGRCVFIIMTLILIACMSLCKHLIFLTLCFQLFSLLEWWGLEVLLNKECFPWLQFLWICHHSFVLFVPSDPTSSNWRQREICVTGLYAEL